MRYFMLSLALIIAGCQVQERIVTKPPINVPVYGVSTVKSKPGEDTRCTCGQSQGVSAVSNDPSRTRVSKIEVTVKDATLGTIIQKTVRDDVVGANSSIFLGCSIAQDSIPTCQKINSFRLISEVVVNTATVSELAAGFPKSFNNDAVTCSRRCMAGGDCLDLGTSGAKLVAPFVALLDASTTTVGEVKMADVMSKFGLSASDDPCKRGNIMVDPTSLENSGPNECSVRLSGGLPPGTLPIDIRIGIAKKIVASKGSAKSVTPVGSMSQLLAFSDRDNGASVEFNKADGTYDVDLLNLYGGEVHSAVRIDDQVFLATANGCIAARTK